jgi:HK97 family phage portal protein
MMAGGFVRSLMTKSVAPLDMLPDFLRGPASNSGVSVTWSTALQVTAMLCCARVIGEGVASAPCKLMKERADRAGADKQRDHPLYFLLSRRPNQWQTAFEFWETVALHVLFCGNAFVFLNRVSGGRIFEFIVMEPQRVKVTRAADFSLTYEVGGQDGTVQKMTSQEVWHIRGPSWNGWMGMETVRLAREALGLSLALESAHASQHASGSVQPGTYSVKDPLTAEQQSQLSQWIRNHFTGPQKGYPLVLDRGAEWMAQQMSGVDAQHLETRRFQIEEVCRAARVLPIMVMQQEHAASYASSEQMFLQHRVHCLDPWTGRLAQSADAALLSDNELKDGLYFEFNLNAGMRGDYKSRQEGLQIQRRNGVLSANEWRDHEGMNPRDDDGGDQYIVEGNMALQDGRDLVPVSISKVAQ